MERSYIKDLKHQVDEPVLIKGWAKTIRKQGGITFIIVRDVTGIVQGVVAKNTPETFELVNNLTTESVIQVEGKVSEEKQAPNGFELHVTDIKVLSAAEPELPIPITDEKGNEADVTKRFDWRWIDLRNPENLNIFKVWTELEKGFRNYINNNGYVQFYSPSLMTAPSESGSEVFSVEYFERKAFLAQSPQFYKQMAMASGFEKVFLVGPVFRAEPSFTPRHMTEFTGWDFEISFIKDHYDVMAEEEQMLVHGFEQVQKTLMPDLKVPKAPFAKLTMKEAKAKLADAGIPSEKDGDLSPEEEREICKIIENETGSEFVFITDYPIDIRPFYHMRYEDDPSITMSFDLLYKGIEITTGAQREHRYDVLYKQAIEKGIIPEEMDYFEFFKYGCPPHGGGGIGPARIIMRMLDINSVKEVTFLPRDVNRLRP